MRLRQCRRCGCGGRFEGDGVESMVLLWDTAAITTKTTKTTTNTTVTRDF